MFTNVSNESFRQVAKRANEKKQKLMDQGGYSPTPHTVFRELLPELDAKHGGRNARDAVVLYLFFFSMVSGDPSNEYYGWAYPSFEQLVEKTGIHRSRITQLIGILEKEGLLVVKSVQNGKHKKKFYCPIPFEGFNDDEN